MMCIICMCIFIISVVSITAGFPVPTADVLSLGLPVVAGENLTAVIVTCVGSAVTLNDCTLEILVGSISEINNGNIAAIQCIGDHVRIMKPLA